MSQSLSRGSRTATAPALALLLAAAAVAHGATPISVTATPKAISRGQTLTLGGSGWGVIEYCKPRVTLTLKRAAPLHDLAIATVNLRTDPLRRGTFSASWVVPASVHSGRRTIVATQRCESGKNGRTILVTRSTSLRVR
jgi:hypothetical protein